MKRAFIVMVGVVVAVAVAWLGIRALTAYELLPEAKAWLAQPEAPVEDEHNLYLAIIGLGVGPDQDPIVDAARLVQDANAWIERQEVGNFKSAAQDDLDPFWSSPPVSPSESVGLLCDPSELTCVDWLRHNSLAEWVEENQLLLQRYGTLHLFEQYRETMLPSFHSPGSNVFTFMLVSKLHVAVATKRFLDGEHDAAIDMLYADLKLARLLANHAGSLVTKMAALALLRRDLQVLSHFASLVTGNSALFDPITPLTPSERSLRKALGYELRMSARMNRELLGNPDAFGDTAIPRWGIKRFFKPAHTLNLTYHLYAQWADLSELDAPEFARAATTIGTDPGEAVHWCDWIYNPIGVTILQLGAPTFGRFTGRAHDVDGLIGLVNLKIALKRAGIPESEAREFLQTNRQTFHSPYTVEPFQYDPETQELFFDGLNNEEESKRIAVLWP
ncbi:MAG: hypothetical protein A2289_13470 [Deltaproteobacteria bacterium RIFOXYA12_FULL_58_15]|nr:MAG: hypothetical protein A2289_13470 [Deltaproteobacteria bacterium RIFOXYA12_FULL_58_15]OGR14960.1 MAG: hypothetical protein A2341_03750 [Deltaproteobacteria bacterium RIFOXYB12_FULL_58_9]